MTPIPKHPRATLATLIWPLIIIAAGTAVYANSFAGAFVFDDKDSIVENASIRHLWPLTIPLAPPRDLTTSGRPFVNFLLAINYAIGGTRAWGYHLGNLIIN